MTKEHEKELRAARDQLREMYRLWHTRGPHATYDAPSIERAILAMDNVLVERVLRPES